MTRPFVAPTQWCEDRPHTLVVCCSDGRWHRQMIEYVHHEVSDRADLYSVPGGPAVLDPWNSSYDESRAFEEGMRLFAKYHDIQGVWLIAHEGCAWYRTKHPHLEADAIRKRQVEDLDRGRAWFRERHPGYDVQLIYASHRGNTVVFEPAETEKPR
jgi:hypothetical protein